jgi:hypothetical protein
MKDRLEAARRRGSLDREIRVSGCPAGLGEPVL